MMSGYCPNIDQNIVYKLSKYHMDNAHLFLIYKILCKYCPDIVKILIKYSMMFHL